MVLSPNRTHFGGPCASTPRDLFFAFFGVIAATLRELLGEDWSPQIDAARQQLLTELQGVVSQSSLQR